MASAAKREKNRFMDKSFVQSYGKSRINSRFTLLARNRPLAALEGVLSREILEI